MNLHEAVSMWERNPKGFNAYECPDGAYFGIWPEVGSVVCVQDHAAANVVLEWIRRSNICLEFCGMRRMHHHPEYFFVVTNDQLEEQWSTPAYERIV